MGRSGGGSRSGGVSGGRSGGGSRSSSHSSSSRSSFSHRSSSHRNSSYDDSSNTGAISARYITRKHQVEGTSPYLIYDKKHRKAELIYTNYNPAEAASSPRKVVAITFAVIVILVSLIGLFACFTIPFKTNTIPHTKDVYDRLGVVTDKAYILNQLDEYFDVTGVTVSIVTVEDAMWEPYYSSLETYATELFYKYMDNETCMILVYSEPVGAEFNDWKWCFYAGDNTVSTLSDKYLSSMTRTIQGKLYKEDPIRGMVDGLIASLDYRKVEFYGDNGLGWWITAGFFLVFGLLACLVVNDRKYYADAVAVDSTVRIVKCSYCDGTYGSNITDSCPHCGAPVEVEQIQGG